ncbi:hypothetical protein Zmor_010514 [Zophobas morio]|uniref:Secreted protein n=1 Tax=Zophobas morio TaxID=2755281 RepID=A0AA38MK20_9CUCU|nr:hypothetical protein Zmor_010514 [Zophobas morio]
MYKIITAQLHWVFSTLVGLHLLTEFSSRCLEHPSRHPLPDSSPAAVTDNESSSPYILEPIIGVVPGRRMGLFRNNRLQKIQYKSSVKSC